VNKLVAELPKIVVNSITENEDGSADVELALDPQAVKLLIDIGVNQLLKEHLENTEDKDKEKEK
tara:strand:+ start:24 stop:215 length:192 start_codon:yes stop_codon:yes gene_type:complete